jgi:hypothetical protein
MFMIIQNRRKVFQPSKIEGFLTFLVGRTRVGKGALVSGTDIGSSGVGSGSIGFIPAFGL